MRLRWALLSQLTTKQLGWASKNASVRGSSMRLGSADNKGLHTAPTSFNHKALLRWDQKLWRLFQLHWPLVSVKGNPRYSTHRDFRLFFLAASPSKSLAGVVSAHHYFHKWLDSHNFLFSVFASNASIQMFSHKLFIEESLVLNWTLGIRNYKLFKYTQPFFVFSDLSHGSFVQSAMSLMLSQYLDLAVVTDVKNHSKTLFHIQRASLPSVALVPISYSPWQVSYPVPMFSDSKLTQLYFIKWLFSIKSQSQLLLHEQTYLSWKNRRDY